MSFPQATAEQTNIKLSAMTLPMALHEQLHANIHLNTMSLPMVLHKNCMPTSTYTQCAYHWPYTMTLAMSLTQATAEQTNINLNALTLPMALHKQLHANIHLKHNELTNALAQKNCMPTSTYTH